MAVAYLTSEGKYLVVGADAKFLQVTIPGFLLTFSGYIISDQGSLITERGFIYGTLADQLTQSVVSESESILFEATVEVPAGTYYYKAYATNELGTSYGELKSVTVG